MKNLGFQRKESAFCCNLFFTILSLVLMVGGLLTGCGQNNAPSALAADTASQNTSATSESYSMDLFAMDTVMTLTAYGDSAQAAIEVSAAEIQRLEQLFSTNLEDSDIARLNQDKQAQLPDEAISVLQKAVQLYQDTNGAFDITLYPIIKAWGFTTENYRIPTSEELQQFLQHTGIDCITLDVDTGMVQLTDAQTEIDLGGIVKGYTSDKVIQQMASYGVQSAVISLGGNVQTLGTKPDGSLWRVGIQDPDAPDECIGVVETANQAVITSGPYQRYFIGEDGTRYHHIIDPQKGVSAESGLSSVTIVSDSGILADGLSTALFVMGTDHALEYWQQRRADFDTILITNDRQIIITAGLADCFQSEYDYYVFGE